MTAGKLYVVGFMLDAQREHVVLIEKNRPAWQAGKLNGVGGKVEPFESAHQAMAREFQEETGLATHPADWDHICGIEWPDDVVRVASAINARVDFFRYVAGGWLDQSEIETKTDEAVLILPVTVAQTDLVIPNLRWLIPLACYTADRYEPFTLTATAAEAVQ